MKLVHGYDENGFFIESIMINDNEQIPDNCTEIQFQSGLFKAKFIDGQWVEGLSDEEIQAIKNTPPPISPLDQLQKDQADLMLQLVMKGVL